MFNVCPNCGEYNVAKVVAPDGASAICPGCSHAHPFRRLPLFVLTGASGAGKTAVCLRLPSLLPECVVLETDILLGVGLPAWEDPVYGYWEMWLRLAKNIGQSRRPVLLGGTVLPEHLENSPERRYVGRIHYLALVCDDTLLRHRLAERPAWRASHQPVFVERMIQFNHWLEENAASLDPPLTLLDTSTLSLEQTADAVARWVRAFLP